MGRGWGVAPSGARVFPAPEHRPDVAVWAMTDEARAVLREALALADDERADVAAELLASLDDGADDPALAQREWAREIERRARRGPSDDAIEWSELRGRVLHGLTSE